MRRPTRSHCLALSALWLAAITPCQAELYKWVDENGRTHYSDTVHPAAETTASVVQLPTEPASATAATPAPDLLASRQALMRKPDQHLPRIVVTALPLPDTRQPIGVLRAGELCRNIMPLYWPDVRQQRAYLAPDAVRLGSTAAQSLSHFDYEVMHTSTETALSQQRRVNGLLLQLQIHHLQLETCAPDPQAGTLAYNPASLASLVFRRHQLQLSLDWTLTGTDGQRLFSGQTQGSAGNLQRNDEIGHVYQQAMEQAVMALLANPALQSALQAVTSPAPKPAPAFQAAAPDTDEGWGFSKLLPSTWQQRAGLANVLAGMAQLKVPMTEFYLTEGEWPTRFEQMGLPPTPVIADAMILLQPGGVLVARLPEQFGPGKELFLRGPTDPSVIGAQWRCETDADIRPEACSGLAPH